MEKEEIIAVPDAIRPVASVRSTLIQSSLDVLRKRGHFERYLTFLEPSAKPGILETLAPEWLPSELASAHYSACDALGLSANELKEIGLAVGERIQGTFVGTLVRRARTIGLTPWVVLAQFTRLWARLMEGGGVGVMKTGPKDCTVDVRGLGIARFEYFRVAFCGVVASGIILGAGRAPTVRVGLGANYAQRLLLHCWWV